MSQGRILGAQPARAPPKIGKNMIFWRKIVIFQTKYPSARRNFFKSAPPNLKSWMNPKLVCMRYIFKMIKALLR